jgi:hypothetical protein
MVLNNLFPIFALILFGSLLKRWRLTDEVFLKMADRLTYFIFFRPCFSGKSGGPRPPCPTEPVYTRPPYVRCSPFTP